MNNIRRTVTLGTRGSALARWQTEHISKLLQAAWSDLAAETRIITTQGDRVLDTPLPLLGGKGVFTLELETALRDRSIDFAVHSLKDLPTENPEGLILGAIPERASAHDVLISRAGHTLATLPRGATVGTSSRRRASQLLRRRPDLKLVDIRGNIDTRIRKALDADGIYDAIVLASAGLERLGQSAVISEVLALEDMLPAPGQGALAVQCRDELEARTLLAPIKHTETEIAVTAERAFLAGLGGGCALPIAAYAFVEQGTLNVLGRVTAPDGSQQVEVRLAGAVETASARQLGYELAALALEQGAAALIDQVK